GRALKAYREAAKGLLEAKYPDLADVVPPHLKGKCSCFAVVCDDALVLRWDEDPEPKVRIGTNVTTPDQALVEIWAPRLSERFVWCPPNATGFQLPPDGQRLQFFKVSQDGKQELVIDT